MCVCVCVCVCVYTPIYAQMYTVCKLYMVDVIVALSHAHNYCERSELSDLFNGTDFLYIPYIGYLMRVSKECKIAFFTGFAKFLRALI